MTDHIADAGKKVPDHPALIERLEGGPGDCPFCGRDPYHYVDNGVGMERVAVTCCDEGIAYFQHGDPVLAEQVALRHEAAAALRDLTAFVQSVSDVPLEDIELEYTAANLLHGRGALTKGVKTEGVIAVKTLRAILRAARDRLPSAPNQAKEGGE